MNEVNSSRFVEPEIWGVKYQKMEVEIKSVFLGR
jgi:hypothetical protein